MENVSTGPTQDDRPQWEVRLAVFLSGRAWPTIAGMDEQELALRADVYMAQLAVARAEAAALPADQVEGAIAGLRRRMDAAAAAGLEPWRSARAGGDDAE